MMNETPREYTDSENSTLPLYEVETNLPRYVICHQVNYVYYGLGLEVEYPDGYEVKGKWEVREYEGDSAALVEWGLNLTQAKQYAADGLYWIDRSQQAPAFTR